MAVCTHTHTHIMCSCAKQVANCLYFCLHFFENRVALISINFYVGQHLDQFIFRNDSPCHLVPLANCLKNSIKKIFHAAPQEISGFFSSFSSHLQQSLSIHPGAAWRSGAAPETNRSRWARVKAGGLRGSLTAVLSSSGGESANPNRRHLYFFSSGNPSPLCCCCSQHLNNSFPNNVTFKTPSNCR